MSTLLLGALVTLIGACLVQIAVVPRVQAGTRQRERWERDVLELTALLEEELPRALNGYRSASIGPRLAQQWQDDPEVDQQKLKALLSEWNAEQREANMVVGDKMARLDVLVRRIRRVHPDASYRLTLSMRRVSLSVALWDVEPQHSVPTLRVPKTMSVQVTPHVRTREGRRRDDHVYGCRGA